jgi:GAF domain-containing protein
LEQQTATAEVLQVINSSPGDLTPVFDAMLDKAMALCEASDATLYTLDGERARFVAARGTSGAVEWARQQSVIDPPSGSSIDRLRRGERFVHLLDARETDAYRDSPLYREMIDVSGCRSSIAVALRREETVIGVIAIYRQEVRPFTDKQIGLLQNFAAQAVIAMENARLLTETREALEQQTATAEVLQVINSSPGDLAPVFDAITEKAMRLCQAAYGGLWTYDGLSMHLAGSRGFPGEAVEAFREFVPPVGAMSYEIVHGAPVVHIADVSGSEAYRTGVSSVIAMVDTTGIKTGLWIALRKDDDLLGMFVLYRAEIRPFTEKQIALLQNFAAQAVIAMENARLLTETREALEQQTATAEVLQVINSSPGDLAPVFDTMVDTAARLCGTNVAGLAIRVGDAYRYVATRSLNPQWDAYVSGFSFKPERGTATGRTLLERRIIHVADLAADPEHTVPEIVSVGGIRTFLGVPLLREGEPIGVLALARQQVEPFTERQIALVDTFAAQAVIAMENARLITETREALEQQTATAEVLQVINSSPGDLAPVFDAILEKAHTLCGAAHGAMGTYDSDYYFRTIATRGYPEPLAERLRQGFAGSTNPVTRPLIDGARFVQIPNMAEVDHPIPRAAAELGGMRTGLFVPLRKDNVLIGHISATRPEIRLFAEKDITLIENFAAQAVIAMENARLITELQRRTGDLQESLEYQTATSDVLRVIGSSAGELDPVLQTLVETAARICEADTAAILRVRGDELWLAASLGFPAEWNELFARQPFEPNRASVTGRAALERRAIHVEDVTTDPEYGWPNSQQLGRYRTTLAVPLMRHESLVGIITLGRFRVESFTEKQIALVQTFADQAVIAIENARLFNELRDRTAELVRSVEELQLLSEVGHAVSSALDVRAVLSTILVRSVGMTGADAGAVFRYRLADRSFSLVEAFGWEDALLRSLGEQHIPERNCDGRGGGPTRARPARRHCRDTEQTVARHEPRRRIPRRADRAIGRAGPYPRRARPAATCGGEVPAGGRSFNADIGKSIGIGDRERAADQPAARAHRCRGGGARRGRGRERGEIDVSGDDEP